MKSKWTTIGILSAGLLLVLAVGLSQAQGPEPPEGGVQPQGEVSIAASVPCGIPIQGRLTDASGNYYHIYCTSDNCRLSADEGFVRLQLYFANGAHNITLGGVRVTLEHD